MIERVAVVGAGVMGAGIAQSLATAGVNVQLVDVSSAQLDEARRVVVEGRYGWERAVARNKISADDAAGARDRLLFTTDLAEAVDGASMVLEAVPEVLSTKLRLFRQLGSSTHPDVVLASNTSGFPIVALAEVADRPQRVIGWHWASPAQIRPFAEIVRTDQTATDTVDAVVELATRCGKNPVVVTENPLVWGFVANRIFVAAVHEAHRVVEEGLATREQVDQLVRDAYGWPAGPFGVVAGATEGWGDERKGAVGS